MFGHVLIIQFTNKACHLQIKICYFMSFGNDHKTYAVAFQTILLTYQNCATRCDHPEVVKLSVYERYTRESSTEEVNIQSKN